MLAEISGKTDVKFSMQVLGVVYAHLHFSGNYILTKLNDAILHFFAVISLFHVFYESISVLAFGFVAISSEKHHSLLMLMPNVVDVNTDKNAYLLHTFQFFTQLEIARGAEISHYCEESIKVGHSLYNAFEFVE